MKTPYVKPSWTLAQRRMLQRYLCDPKYTVCYHNTDQHGFSANGGDRRVRSFPGAVHKGWAVGPCRQGALHATLMPHRWRGCRTWIVALENARPADLPADLKLYTLQRRVVIGELLPEDCLDPAVMLRLGATHFPASSLIQPLAGENLRFADLEKAPLRFARLQGADLGYSSMVEADLELANMADADLQGVNLDRANLRNATLIRANLRAANMNDAFATGAQLQQADLSNAAARRCDLQWATLTRANLQGAQLCCADLSFATLDGANLRAANLLGATLRGTRMKGAIFSIGVDLQELESRGAIFE